METIGILIVSGVMCCVCFLMGASVGQKVAGGEKVEMPAVNPAKAIRAAMDNKKAAREQEKIDTILRNIDSYDGTGFGQADIPGV